MLFQSSGVSVDPACVPIFNELKLGHKYRYIIFSLNEDLTKICVLAVGHPGKHKAIKFLEYVYPKRI